MTQDAYELALHRLGAWWCMERSVITPAEAALNRLDDPTPQERVAA
jgi:hypothetical protein